MDPNDIREVRDLKRLAKIQNSYNTELIQGKVSKRFKPVKFDLVAEYLDNSKYSPEEIALNNDSDPETFQNPSSPTSDPANLLSIPQKRSKPESPTPINISEAKSQLISLLNPNETVAQAIHRLRGPISKPVPYKKNIRKNSNSTTSKPIQETPQEDYKTLCQLCSDLIASGIDDLYSLTPEDLK